MTKKQEIALALLRVTIGMLLVWWGLAKIVNPGMGVMISKKFYFDLVSIKDMQFYFAWFELLIGSCVVVGLFRKYTMPVQMAITGISSLAIWNALLDPFALYLPVAKVAGIQHLFYPSLIILAASFALYSLRAYDRFNVDSLMAARKNKRSTEDETVPEPAIA